jgi:crotonobetainyl-CoA:carnitine CoA-transferase CaiB-like acyl-CoA transferase
VIKNLEGQQESTPLPLSGFRVLAWEQAVAAPFASRHLGDLGADVIKVERPGGGDFTRGSDGFSNGLSSYFVWNNRNKRSITIDLKDEAGRKTFDQLLDQADIFLLNQGPGVAERNGYGYEAVSRRNPRIVYCSITGFGTGGPYDERRAYDVLIQGEAGLMSITGTPDALCKVGASVADVASGFHAFSAILALLLRRERTGKGGEIQISMLESLVDWCVPQLMTTHYTGKQPPRIGMRHPSMVPNGVYMCADGVGVNIAGQNQTQWEKLCREVFRRPELITDKRFLSNGLRVQNREALDPILDECFAQAPREEMERRLENAGLPFASVNDLKDVNDHPQLAARGRWFEVPSPVGPIRQFHSPLNIAGMDRPDGAIPDVGEHTEEILRELRDGKR